MGTPAWFCRVIVLLGVLSGLSVAVLGQEVPPGAVTRSGGVTAVSDDEGVPAGSEGAQDLLLRTENGRLIPLRELLGADAVSVLLARAGEQQLPGYWVARLELRGKVEADVVDLDVELQVMVRTVSEWISVPLSFGDVYLTDFQHSSSVPAAESVLQVGDQNQRRWSLRGAGLHQLKFHLAGKTRTAGPGIHQLNLVLPESAASHAVFEFSRPVELQKLPVGAVDRQTRDAGGVRKVEFVGLSGPVPLFWSEVSPPVAVKPVVQVQNRMKLDLTTIPASLTGTLQLQVTGSALSDVLVTWPEGFVVREIQARNGSAVSVLDNYELTEGSGEREALIRLSAPVEGNLVLEYEAERSDRSFPQNIRVSVPLVRDATVQTGDVELIFPAGLLVQQKKVEGAQRRRVTAETDGGAAATAFRLRSRDSFIELHVEEMEAQYAVTTELGIRPQGTSVLLTGQMRVNVLRGALQELLLDWTSMAEGSAWTEWSLLPGGARLQRNGRSIPLTPEVSPGAPGLPGTLRFVFPERQSGEFLLDFQAVTEVPAGTSADTLAGWLEKNRLLLQCPQVQSRRGQPVVLRTEESDEYQAVLLNGTSGERLRAVPAASTLAAGFSGGSPGPAGPGPGSATDSERGASWLQENSGEPVWIHLVPQRQTIRASLSAGLTATPRGVEVLETIELDVMHRAISEVTLLVPETVQPLVRVAGEEGSLRAVIGKSNEWTFRLPQSKRGTLVLEVRWLKGLGAIASGGSESVNSEEDLNIDLVVPRAARIWRVLAGTSASGLEVRVGGGWEPVYSEKYSSAWRNLQWSVGGGVDVDGAVAAVASAGGVGVSSAASGGAVGGVPESALAVPGGDVESLRPAGQVQVPLRYRRGSLEGMGWGPVLTLAESRVFAGQALTTCRWYFENRPERLVLEVPDDLSLESIVLGGQSLNGRSGVLQARRDTVQRVVKWEILPEVLSGLEPATGGQVVLEVRVRQELRVAAGMRGLAERLRPRELQRVRVRGESSSATLMWLLRPQSGLRVVTSAAPLASLSPLPSRVFGSESSARTVSQRQLEAVLSAFPEGIQVAARECGEDWLKESGGHDLCLGSGENLVARVTVVPQSLLLLITASMSLVVFVWLTWLIRLPLGLPIPLAAAGLTGLWVAVPDWAALVLPWSLAGVMAGILGAAVHRWSLLRRYGVAPLRRVTERPTVFGFPDYADSGLRTLRGVSGGSVGGQSEAAAG
ncbi:MAG: hypothetical protein ACKO2P_08515 [Planctomycetota bacterium]